MIITLHFKNKDKVEFYVNDKKIIENNSLAKAVVFLRENIDNIKFFRVNFNNLEKTDISKILEKLDFINDKDVTYCSENEIKIMKEKKINIKKETLFIYFDDLEVLYYDVKNYKTILFHQKKLNSYTTNMLNIEEDNYFLNKMLASRTRFVRTSIKDINNVTTNNLVFSYYLNDKVAISLLKYLKRSFNKDFNEIIKRKPYEQIIVNDCLRFFCSKEDVTKFIETKVPVLVIRQKTLNVGKTLNKCLGVKKNDWIQRRRLLQEVK